MNAYSDNRLVVVLVVYTSGMDMWTLVVLLIFFKMVKPHCSDWVIRQFSYRQHILVDIDTSNALHTITQYYLVPILCTKKWDIYRDASRDYKWGVYDLVYKYHISNHYSRSRASFITWIHEQHTQRIQNPVGNQIFS